MKKYEDYEPISGPMMCLAFVGVFAGAIYFGAFDKKEDSDNLEKSAPKLVEKKIVVSPLNELKVKERGE